MGLRIDNTPNSIFAQRQTEQAINRINRGLQQLASGLRINRAAEDAAGLAIAERFRSSVLQLSQEANNLQTGINAAQTAEGGLSAQADAVARLRELATQAANGTLTAEQRAALNQEAQQLLQEIDATAQNTEFNDRRLLDGTATNIALDPEGENQLNINASTVNALGLTGLDLSTQAGAQNALNALDTAASRISTNRAGIGAQQNRFERAIENRTQQAQNLREAESRIRDLDIARSVIEQTRNQVLLRGGLAAIVQGNLQSQTALRLLGG